MTSLFLMTAAKNVKTCRLFFKTRYNFTLYK